MSEKANDQEFLDKLNAGLAFDDPEGMAMLDHITAGGPAKPKTFLVQVQRVIYQEVTIVAYSVEEALNIVDAHFDMCREPYSAEFLSEHEATEKVEFEDGNAQSWTLKFAKAEEDSAELTARCISEDEDDEEDMTPY